MQLTSIWKQSLSHSHISFLITNSIFQFTTFLEYTFLNNYFLYETQEKTSSWCIYPETLSVELQVIWVCQEVILVT